MQISRSEDVGVALGLCLGQQGGVVLVDDLCHHVKEMQEDVNKLCSFQDDENE